MVTDLICQTDMSRRIDDSYQAYKCWSNRLVNELAGGEREANCIDERCKELSGFGQL
jgi:hypothetical protein